MLAPLLLPALAGKRAILRKNTWEMYILPLARVRNSSTFGHRAPGVDNAVNLARPDPIEQELATKRISFNALRPIQEEIPTTQRRDLGETYNG